MKKNYSLLFSIAVLFLIPSCTIRMPPPFLEINKDYIEKSIDNNQVWSKIAVLPFTGNPAFHRTSTEFFTFLLQKHHHIEIIEPALSILQLKEDDSINLENLYEEEETAQKIAQILNVSAVIIGNVSDDFAEGLRVGVKLVEAESGKIILTTMAPGIKEQFGTLRMNDMETWRKAVIISTKSAALEVVSLLYQMEGKNWEKPRIIHLNL